MGRGSKRNDTDRVMVSTGLGTGTGTRSSTEQAQECPLSFKVKLNDEHRKRVGSSVTAQAVKDEVTIVADGGEVIASVKGKRGSHIAGCIRDGHYKYSGTIVLEDKNVYAQLRIT